jgi:hypothetical protein
MTATTTAMTRRLPLLLALGLLVAGCASQAQLAQRDHDRCVARGYQPDTREFNACLVQLQGARDARMETNRREMLERPNVPYIPSSSNR